MRDACLDVVERDGRPFAHVKARIRNVRSGTVEADVSPSGGARLTLWLPGSTSPVPEWTPAS